MSIETTEGSHTAKLGANPAEFEFRDNMYVSVVSYTIVGSYTCSPWQSEGVRLKLRWRRWWFYKKKVVIEVSTEGHSDDTEFTCFGK